MNITPVEENNETLEAPIIGSIPITWLTRSILKGLPGHEEQVDNLIIHFFEVKHDNFINVLVEAWELSGLASQGIPMERSYTEEFKAYDAILGGIDPCYAVSFKDMFLEGVKRSLFEEQEMLKNKPPEPEEEENDDDEDDEDADPDDGFQVLT